MHFFLLTLLRPNLTDGATESRAQGVTQDAVGEVHGVRVGLARGGAARQRGCVGGVAVSDVHATLVCFPASKTDQKGLLSFFNFRNSPGDSRIPCLDVKCPSSVFPGGLSSGRGLCCPAGRTVVLGAVSAGRKGGGAARTRSAGLSPVPLAERSLLWLRAMRF